LALLWSRPRGPDPRVSIERGGDDCLRITLTGPWRVANGVASLVPVTQEFAHGNYVAGITVDAKVEAYDSSLIAFLLKLHEICALGDIPLTLEGLPEGARRLYALATAVPEREGAARSGLGFAPLTVLGKTALGFAKQGRDWLNFLGSITVSGLRLLRGKAQFQQRDFLLFVEECGAQALPIVTIVSLLVGLILAFIGAMQLKVFGAELYVANLVAVAMAREMAALMTAIVLAGRTGAAFAAQIGAMQGNEEVDALTTLGISPIDFLVLPRVLALVLMTPLLCLYSNLMGLIGGYVVSVGILDITGTAYINQTMLAVKLGDFAVGLVKSLVFGVIIASSGCLQGLRAGRSAAAVGEATTNAVVSCILLIIIADGIFAVLLNMLKL
jgi:phospholipid/cholesterol/gamma-HCH transport system permease protein